MDSNLIYLENGLTMHIQDLITDHKYMSKYQRIRMDILFLNLFGKEIYGKKDNSNV